MPGKNGVRFAQLVYDVRAEEELNDVRCTA